MAYKHEDILDNGLCFIEKALSELESNEDDNKYVTLHLFSGIFLILKMPLYSEHWSLIVSNIDKTKYSDFKNGDFHGVNFHNCLKRIEEILSITIEKDDRDLLERLRKRRNKIEHFTKKHSEGSEKAILYKGLEFITRFIRDNVKYKNLDRISERINSIKEKAREFEEFCKERISKIERDLEGSEVLLTCNECGFKYWNLEEDILSCLFCQNETNLDEVDHIKECDEFLYRDVRRTKDYLDVQDIICSGCKSENKLIPIQENEKKIYLCLSCQEKFNFMVECSGCGRLFLNNSDDFDTGNCSDCFSNFVDRN